MRVNYYFFISACRKFQTHSSNSVLLGMNQWYSGWANPVALVFAYWLKSKCLRPLRWYYCRCWCFTISYGKHENSSFYFKTICLGKKLPSIYTSASVQCGQVWHKTKSVLITSKGFATLRNVPKLPFVSFRFENIRAEFVRGISRSLWVLWAKINILT